MRLYLVGAGVIARTHAEAAEKLPEQVHLRVTDTNPQALASFLELYPNAIAYSNVQEMLDSEEALEDDIVVIGTPPFAHFELTKVSLKSGRHVLCEKPLAMNLEQAEEMMRIAKAEGRFLGCCSVRFKGMPHMETVKRILTSGKLGEIYHVSFVNKWERSRAGIEYQPTSPWFLDSKKSGGGVLMDWGPYDLTTLTDILNPKSVEINAAFLAKPVTASDPVNTPFDIETHVGASMTFQCERVPVHVNYERATCTHGRSYVKVEIEGTHGSLHWTPFDSKGPVLYCYDLQGELVEEQVDTGPRSALTIFDNPLNHFYRKVNGLESHANVNEKALVNFRCIRAVYTAAETGQKQIVSIG